MKIIKERTTWLVWLAIACYTVLFSCICLWKYQNFFYNVMDLAIINQVFFNSALGNWFASSIHPPSYLGDHFTPIVFLLLPFYIFKKTPETLLVIQTVGLALSAWPIFLIAKNILNKNLAALLALAWLINPFVQNINLFEFHFLPLAIFFISFAFYFYQKEKFFGFLTFSIMALLVREDVLLVILMFIVLAWLDKKPFKFKVAPFALAVLYFILILITKNVLKIDSGYKFFIYYAWLGPTPFVALQNLIFEPWRIVIHLIKFGNIEFILGLLMPLLFLPLVSPKYLILGLPVLIQLIMRTDGASATLLETHYPALILPAVFIAGIYSLERIQKNNGKKITQLINQYKPLMLMIFIVGLIYNFVTLGPILGVVKKINQDNSSNIKKEIISQLPETAKVAVTYGFLTNLSSRTDIYSFNYVFLGQQQFLKNTYDLPNNTEYILIDFNELLTYQLQYGNNSFYEKKYDEANKKFSQIFNNYGLIDIKDTIALYQKGQTGRFELIKVWEEEPEVSNQQNIILSPDITFIGHNKKDGQYQLFWKIKGQINHQYYLEILNSENKTKIYPLAYGLNPEIKGQKTLQTNYWFEAGQNLKFKLIKVIKGGVEIDDIRSTKNVIDQQEEIGPEISI